MKTPKVSYRNSRGLSLVELMVGVAIGLVCVLVMFQVVNLWENTRRATTAGSETQITGAVASFEFDRDLKLAGMGFGTADDTQTGCSVSWQNSDPEVALAGQVLPLAPVTITPGADGAPDIVSVLHGDSSFFVSNENIAASTTTTKNVSSQAGFQLGDLVIYAGAPVGPMLCGLVQITGNSNANGITLEHASGVPFTNFYTGEVKVSPFNGAAGSPAGFDKGVLFNLGPSPALNDWTITNGSLTVNNRLRSKVPSVVAENVVNLKAEYVMVDPLTRAVTWTTTTPDPKDWRRLKAVRFALLIRSPDYESTAVFVGSDAPVYRSGDGTEHKFTMTDLDGSVPVEGGDLNDWRHYRYRVYESTVVMRNMMWATQ